MYWPGPAEGDRGSKAGDIASAGQVLRQGIGVRTDVELILDDGAMNCLMPGVALVL